MEAFMVLLLVLVLMIKNKRFWQIKL